jgi:hypothetical protein
MTKCRQRAHESAIRRHWEWTGASGNVGSMGPHNRPTRQREAAGPARHFEFCGSRRRPCPLVPTFLAPEFSNARALDPQIYRTRPGRAPPPALAGRGDRPTTAARLDPGLRHLLPLDLASAGGCTSEVGFGLPAPSCVTMDPTNQRSSGAGRRSSVAATMGRGGACVHGQQHVPAPTSLRSPSLPELQQAQSAMPPNPSWYVLSCPLVVMPE